MKNFIPVMMLALVGPVYAGNNDGNCDHPVFVEKDCAAQYGIPGPQGEPGVDGRDGVDGKDGAQGPRGPRGFAGADGVDGKDGRDGVDGKDGRDGVDGAATQAWVDNTTNVTYNLEDWRRDAREYSAAQNAISIHLPSQPGKSRISIGSGFVDSTFGYGVGYAYKFENESHFTLGFGTASGKTVGKASLGFEF